MLKAHRGAVVNTSSISGLSASPFEAAYCTSKGAILQLTRAIAVEYRDRGIRCNSLCPGFIRTAHGLRELAELASVGQPLSDRSIAGVQGRRCEPREVARAALFQASNDSTFVNGAVMVVENGWLALT